MRERNITNIFLVLLAFVFIACGGGSGGNEVSSNDKNPETIKKDPKQDSKQDNKAVKFVLKTGQSKSYISGDDGDLKKGTQRNFVNNGNTVTDNVNKLIWQDEPYTQEEVSAYNKDQEAGKVKTWHNAIKYCQDKGDGWRLPSIKELSTIINYSQVTPKGAIEPAFKNAINIDLKDNPENQKYWSSTKGIGGYSRQVFALVVTNGIIQAYGYEQDDWVNYVRCVKDMK